MNLNIIKKTAFKNIAILTSGTVLSQLIPILILPLLTRLYTPEDFGAYAVMLSTIGILMPIVTARYELAIMLPKSNNQAMHLLKVILFVVITSSSIFLLLILIFGDSFSELLFDNSKYSLIVYLIPFILCLAGSAAGLNYYANRLEKYKLMASSRVLRSIFSSGSQLVLFNVGVKNIGLSLGYFLGELALLYFLTTKMFGDFFSSKARKEDLIKVAYRYNRFPKFDIVTTLISQLSQRGLVIIFGIIFSPAIAGFYGLTRHVLAAPLAFIGTSVMDVFKQYAAESYRTKGNCTDIYWQFFVGLFVIGFFGFLILFNYGSGIFALVFGEDWRIAGVYAEILSFALFFRFISSPLSYVLYIAEKQNLLLFIQILFFLVMCLSAFLGFMENSVTTSLYTFSYLSSMVYIYVLFLSYKYSNQKSNNS